MAEIDSCLFPAMEVCLDDDDLPDLASPDFLKFLAEHDLTGDLPIIPDACASQPSSPEVTSQVTLPPQPVPHLHLQLTGVPAMQMQQPVVSTTTIMAPFSGAQSALQPLQPAFQFGSLTQAPLVLQQQQQQQQVMLPPGSPISSNPTSSSDTSALPALKPQFSIGISSGATTSRSRQQQQSSGGTASTQQQQQQPLTKQQIAANKRKAPEIDWRSISDPAERRKQRRLAKNRVTAARSRERKKEQMSVMEERMTSLEQENSQMRALLASLAQENASLKEQLASLTRGAATNITGSGPEPAVLIKCLAIMHLGCLLLTVKVSLGLVFTLASMLPQQLALHPGSSPVAGVFKSTSHVSAPALSCAAQRVGDEQLVVLLRARLKRAGCCTDLCGGRSAWQHRPSAWQHWPSHVASAASCCAAS